MGDSEGEEELEIQQADDESGGSGQKARGLRSENAQPEGVRERLNRERHNLIGAQPRELDIGDIEISIGQRAAADVKQEYPDAESHWGKIRELLKQAPAIEGAPGDTKYAKAEKLDRWLAEIRSHNNCLRDYQQSITLKVMECEYNIGLTLWYDDRSDEFDYKLKLEIIRHMNSDLREEELAIEHSETYKPCMLLAVTSRDGFGRYTLEDRITKKRSGSYKAIIDLLPIKLMPGIPRREPLLESREKNAPPDYYPGAV